MSDEVMSQLRTENEQLAKAWVSRGREMDFLRAKFTELHQERDQLRAQVAQLRGVLELIAGAHPTARRLSYAECIEVAGKALSTPAPAMIEREKVMPLSASDIMECAVSGKPIPAMRALATYAEESNWTQLYEGKSVDGYKPHACEWAFIGPVRPPYELAQNVLTQLGLLEDGR